MEPFSSIYNLRRLFSFKLLRFAAFAIAAVGFLLFNINRFANRWCGLPPAFTAITAKLNSPKTTSSQANSKEELQEGNNDYNLAEATRLELIAKMETGKDLQAVIDLTSKLIELRPEDQIEWRLLKGYMYCYMGESESARSEFESILEIDIVEPVADPSRSGSSRVFAYQGLLTAAVDLKVKMGEDMSAKQLREKISDTEASLVCAVRLVEIGDYGGALKEYGAIVAKVPWDYRAYLSQGIVYVLLRNRIEAEEMFRKYKALVVRQGRTPCDTEKYFKD